MKLLAIEELVVRFGGVTALDEPSLAVEPGQICGLIGPNGAGKTTLFNCVSRLVEPQSGSIRFDGRELLGLAPHDMAAAGIARTFQNVVLFPTRSVRNEERRLRRDAWDVIHRLDLDRFAHMPASGLAFGTLKRVELARALA